MKTALPGRFLRQLTGAMLVWLGVSFLTVAAFRIIPGDPLRIMLDTGATESQIQQQREQFGLDRSLLEQFWRYLVNAARGDLGYSIRSREPVLGEILQRLPGTVALGSLGLAIAVSAGIPAGLVAGLTTRRAVRIALELGMIASHSIPAFVLALSALFFSGVLLGWISVSGGGSWLDLLVAGICVALIPGATIARYTQSSVQQVSGKDFVRTARAKGVSEIHVVLHHILRNALIPVFTIAGLLATELMTGTVFIEMVFSRGGLGRYAVEAVLARDFPQVQGIVLLTASGYLLFNQLVDAAYQRIDPRLRHD